MPDDPSLRHEGRRGTADQDEGRVMPRGRSEGGHHAGDGDAGGAQAVASVLRVLLRYESWYVHVGRCNRCRKLEGALDHVEGGVDARRVDFTQ